MAGFVIHLAVAEEYLKFSQKNENYNEFIDGVIAPDMVKDKSLTHYGEKSSEVQLDRFLEDKNLENSFNRGYFLHLITDYIFYNKFFDKYSKDIYHDYDILNSYLIEKYKVKLPEKIKNQVSFKEGDLILLDKDKVEECIKVCSSMEIDEIAKEVRNPKFYDKWLKIRELKYL